jgi:hypothetical protein
VTDGINTAMNSVQAGGGDSTRNTGWGNADSPQLPARNDAVLPLSQLNDGEITRSGAFLSHVRKEVAIRSDFAP